MRPAYNGGMTVDDKYELLAVLAEGGMSRVWRARELSTGRELAIKLPRDEFRQDASMLERFRRECRALLELDHPNLVKALSAGESEGLPYLAMELVEGGDLRSRRGPLSVLQAVDVARQVLAALDYAHGRGLVHRDVGARNVLLDSAGHVKVVDFGIARCVDERTLTKTGQMLGSVSYMAPEQALGEAPTPAVDIYAVGVLLYEMLTGDLPFTSDNPVQLALKHVNEPAPLLPERFGGELQDIVARALAKRPEDRFATASAMQHELARMSLDTTRVMPVVEPVEVTVIRPAVVAPVARRGPRWWHLGAAAIVPLLVTVPLLLSRPAPRPAPAATSSLKTVVVKPPASPSPYPYEAVTAATPPGTPIRVVEVDAMPSPAAPAARVAATPQATPEPRAVTVRTPVPKPVVTPAPATPAEPEPEPEVETRAMMEEEEEAPPPAPAAVEEAMPAPQPIPSLLVLPEDKRPQP